MGKAKRAARAASTKRVVKEPAPKKAATKARPAKRASVPVPSYARDEGLEAAIIDAPLDPVPRMVYADWIQAAGDRRGEWMALHAAIEREPSNVRLRSLAVDFLGVNAELLLGPGKSLLAGAWIGWRGGFIDEIRIQPFEKQRNAIAAFAGLLAHPSARFVRTVGIGALGQGAIDALAEAAPPLLETVVAIDGQYTVAEADLDPIAALPTIRRLGLYRADITIPIPRLVELGCRLGAHEWLREGGCENLERLTVDCSGTTASSIAPLLARVPKLRALRIVQASALDDVLDAAMRLGHLELLDLSHSPLSDADAERFVGWGNLKTLIAIRTQLSGATVSRLEQQGTTVVASRGSVRIEDDREPGGWLHHRIATDGRDGLVTYPGIGPLLFNVGTQHSIHAKAKDATPLLDLSLTFPSQELKTWAWANAAIAHERLLEFDDAELIAREGMLRTPKEPNLYAIVVDALRRTNRLPEALALLPRAFASIRAKPGLGAHTGGRGACLADCMLVLAQAGKHDEVLECRAKWPNLVDHRTDMHAIAAMSEVAVGRITAARTSLAKANGCRLGGVLEHARAVVALAAKKPDLQKALSHVAACKAAPYPEWHWISTDPNLAKLHDLPAFHDLL